MSHYAVAVGRKVGIFSTWPECQQQVTGFSGAKFKKFKTENEALEFIKLYSTCPPPTNNLKTYSKLDKNNSNTGGTCNIQSNQFKTLSLAQADLITKEMDKIEKSIAEGNKRISNLSKSKDANLLLEKPKKRTKLIDHSEINEAKKIKINDSDFIKDKDGFVEVYTDGSCTNNGSVKAKAGLGVYFGENNRLNVSEPVSGRATNNCGEIQAATKAIKLAHNEGIKKLCIKTDSQFLINSVTKWMKGTYY